MTRRKRTILFFVFTLLFLITSLVVVLYSQGYRFDLEEKKVTRSGAFYFKVIPKNVQIELDHRPKDKTDIFFGTSYIDNLFPKKYRIEIKKEGYQSWKKNLEIKEKQVTEAKNIILFPANPSFSVLSNNAADFFFSPDEKKIIILDSQKENWGLKLYDLKTNIKSNLLESGKLIKEKIEFADIEFSQDSKKILLKTKLKEETKFFLIDLTKNPGTLQFLIPLDFLGKKIEKVAFPFEETQNSQGLFFSEDGKLNEVDLTKKKVLPTPLANVLTWAFYNNSLYFLEKDGYLNKTDLSLSVKEKINKIGFKIKTGSQYEIIFGVNSLFLKENEDLYLFNLESKIFEKFFENVKEIKISPDFRKLVYTSDSEIWILFLEDQTSQPQKLENERVFITRFSEKINEVSWLNSNYLVFSVENKIKIAEIDDRDQINIIDLAEFKEPKISFNESDKKLYLLSEGNIARSESLIR